MDLNFVLVMLSLIFLPTGFQYRRVFLGFSETFKEATLMVGSFLLKLQNLTLRY